MANLALSQPDIPSDPSGQQRAASDPATSVWVNASAGSGKTTILTNRVVRLLLAGVRPHKILCLTFTRAAAAEMALRVNQQLSHWAICSDNDLSASLAELQGHAPTAQHMTRARRLFAETLACPGGMRIRTLHAFGQEILRRFPIESGLPPHFAVIEETDARTLQQDVLTDLLRDSAAVPDGTLAKSLALLIDTLGEKGFHEAMRHAVLEQAQLSNAIAQHGDLDILIARMRGELGLAPDDTQASLIASTFAPDVFAEDVMRDVARILLEGSPSFVKQGQAMLVWLEQDEAQRLATHKQYQRFFLTTQGEPFKKFADNALQKKHPTLDDIMRREATRLMGLIERCATAAIAETTAALVVVGHALGQRYAARKREQAALDYDDLVNETLNLLQRPGIAPWILHKLDDGLDHLLVDEAQDTSRAQWSIVATLADEFFAGSTAHNNRRTLFVVGDEKQSIYSFQNADPEAFAEMRRYFDKKITAADQTLAEIPLHVSFRSAPVILKAVDAVFASAAAREGVSAVAVQHLSFKRETLFGRVEVWPLIPRPVDDKTEDNWDLPIGYQSESDPQAELAQKIAATIKDWIARGEVLPGRDRPIRPGDIMILLRKRGRFADLMVRALKQKDVAVTGVDRMRLLQQLPVMDLLALIQFTLLPEDDLNLASLLRGPLLNISEDELMHLAVGRGKISLWQSLKNKAAKFGGVHDYLAAWLGKADFMTPFAMLTQILNMPCPAHLVSGRKAIWSRLGLDALDPIEELLNAAQTFSRRHAPSLQNFLHWLNTSDSEIKRELDSGKDNDAGQVRIMTVHASKGLEAPIVFLPDAANMPRVQDMAKFLWNGTHHLPFYLARKPNSGAMHALWSEARAKQLQEYRRLLYVALTRASHRLYIGGWEAKKKETDSEGSWHNLVVNGMQSSETHAQNVPEGTIVWEDPAMQAAPKKTLPPTAKIIPLPTWAFEAAPLEDMPARAMAPSQIGAPSSAIPDQAFARGRIIHRLLQSLPDVAEAKRETVAARFLAHPQHGLNEAQQKDIRDEVLKLLRRADFAPLFGATSRAEVPLAGMIGKQKITGQVDRLALLDNEVWIVDYKTNRPPPTDAADIPPAYRAQVEVYRQVLAAIYPRCKIRCFLLWTYGPLLMEVLPQ